MIYTAGSLALACLENVIHRSGAALSSGNFSMATIHVEDSVSINEISIEHLVELSEEWQLVPNYHFTQEIGNKWLEEQNSVILKVPSAIIDLEYNFLINPYHADFSKIKIRGVKPFIFDSRLKSTL